MKTNIAGLMSLIKDLEERLSLLNNQILSHAENKRIIELTGKDNMIEDYQEDFKLELKEYEETIQRITYLKSVLYEKNNEFKLSDGRTIQTAIVDNTNLRKLKNLYDRLLTKRNSKIRVTEVNNSYFESTEVNFDVKLLKKKNEELVKKIHDTDFEISKLNSLEFEIK